MTGDDYNRQQRSGCSWAAAAFPFASLIDIVYDLPEEARGRLAVPPENLAVDMSDPGGPGAAKWRVEVNFPACFLINVQDKS
jgi:hypothetical protein